MKFRNTFGTRTIYCKEDTTQTGAKTDRLFLINVSNLTEEQMKEVFGSFGEIESVEFGHLSKGGVRVAYLKFADRKSLQALLKRLRSDASSLPSPSESTDALVRSKVLESHLNACHNLYMTSPQDLRKAAEEELMKYNDELDGIQNETDADGWTVIRRRTRVEDEDVLTAMQLKAKRRREESMKKDFYKFQSRENKRDQLRELREQFERDKEKIEKMKRNRKFNPAFIVC